MTKKNENGIIDLEVKEKEIKKVLGYDNLIYSAGGLFIMEGIIERKGKRYLFRDDDGNFIGFVGWDIDKVGFKIPRNKWEQLPRNSHVELFSLDNPPATVSYVPLLAPFE